MLFYNAYRNGIYAAFFFLPLIFLKLPVNFSMSDLCITFSILIVILNILHTKDVSYLINNEFLIPVTLLIAGFCLSFPQTLYPIESVTAILQIIFIFLIIYPALNQLKSTLWPIKLFTFSTILIVLLLSAFFLIGIDFSYGLFLIEQGWRGRYSFGGNEPNIAARLILQIIPVLIMWIILTPQKYLKIISFILTLISIYAVVSTASRSAALTLVLGLLCMFFFYWKMDHRKFIQIKYSTLIIGLFGLLIAIHVNIGGEQIKALERYETIFDISSSLSSIQRWETIQQAFSMINHHPLIGVGLENSHYYTEISTHNPLIIMWLENGLFGVLGFTLIYAILGLFIYRSWIHNFFNNHYLLVLNVITVMMMLGDMFMANSYKRALWLPALFMIVYYKKCSEKSLLHV
jgi:O-antigen ligase